jgi:hypothetical protein
MDRSYPESATGVKRIVLYTPKTMGNPYTDVTNLDRWRGICGFHARNRELLGGAQGVTSILHVDDVTRRGRIPPLPSDIPTIYKPFSIAALKAAVLDLLEQGGRN